MTSAFKSSIAAVALSMLLSGCYGFKIIDPSGKKATYGLQRVVTADVPVTSLKAYLPKDYSRGFTATLNGNPLNGFSPVPAPDTTIEAPGPDCLPPGEQRVLDPGNTVPINQFNEFIIKGDVKGKPGYDRLLFIPPKLLLTSAIPPNTPSSNAPTLRINVPITVTVVLVPGPKAPLPVTLIPNGPTVSVNGAPAGQAVKAVFPSNTAGTFTVNGVSFGGFSILVAARGVQCATLFGSVRVE